MAAVALSCGGEPPAQHKPCILYGLCTGQCRLAIGSARLAQGRAFELLHITAMRTMVLDHPFFFLENGGCSFIGWHLLGLKGT